MAANDAVSMNVAENRQNVPMAIQENRAAVPMMVAEGGGTPGGLNRKADKVVGAVAGNLAGLDANGNLTDSGKAPGDFLEAPATAGSEGQVLTADGEGGASWQDPTGGDPTEIIDDTAGDGDTDKVWSADKSHELLTEINSKADEPTGTKSAGKVYGLDSNLKPAWIDGGGSVDPSVIAEAVDDWLDEHPEATTTVEDGSITKAKLNSDLQKTVDDVADIKDELVQETDIDLMAKATAGSYRITQSTGAVSANGNWNSYLLDIEDIDENFKAKLYTSSTSYAVCAFYSSKENIGDSTLVGTPITASTSGSYKELVYNDLTIPQTAVCVLFANNKNGTEAYIKSQGKTSKIYTKEEVDNLVQPIASAAEHIEEEIDIIGKNVYWSDIIPEEIQMGRVVYGDVGNAKSVSSTQRWQYATFKVQGIPWVSISTIIYGSSYYGVLFTDDQDEIISRLFIKGADSTEIITDNIIEVPENAVNLYVNKYSNVVGNSPNAKKILTTEALEQAQKDIEIIKDSISWHELNGTARDNLKVSGTIGNAITSSGANAWRYACFDILNHSYLLVSTIIYGSSSVGVYFTTENDVIVATYLNKGENTQETISNYLLKVPATARKIYVNKYSSTYGDSPSVKGIATTEELSSSMSEFRLLSFNCGQFDYGDGTTTDAQYKAYWRNMINGSMFDICALQDYASTFGELQDEAKDVIFGNTIASFLGNGASSENGLHLATRIKAGFLGTIDVGGGSGIWRSTVLKFNVFAMGKNIVLYVGHYQPGAGYESNRETQYANVIADATANGYEYVIFCGDFNAQTISEYEIFKNAGYEICNGGYTGDHVTLRDIYADNIVYTSNLMETHFEVITGHTLNTDHYPILVTFKVKS